MVLRRNPLELWGDAAYRDLHIAGGFLGRRQVLLNAPASVRHVLLDHAENYRRNAVARRVLRPVLGEGLFLAEGEAWRHQRRTIAPALAPRTMPILAGHVVRATAAAETTLARQMYRPIDLLAPLQHLALSIAGQSMFSLEMAGFGDELRAKLLDYGTHFAQPALLDLLLPERIAGPADRGRAAFRSQWLALLDRIIAARAADTTTAAPRDLFDLLAAARDPDTNAVFSHAQLRDELSTLLLAGHETTAVTLFWCLWLAARYPEHQDRLASEAAAADLSASNAAATMAALPCTRAHVDETLRLYPPAFLIVREAVADDPILATMAGTDIRAGTVIIISPWVLHRHHRFWRDPDDFNPDRFLAANSPPDRYTYLPFGAGPRICVGAQFALTEAVLVLARLLARFRIGFAGSGDVLPRGIVTTQPDRPVRFVLTPR